MSKYKKLEGIEGQPIALISRGRGKYYCSCGYVGDFKSFYNHNTFKCEKCGGHISNVTKGKITFKVCDYIIYALSDESVKSKFKVGLNIEDLGNNKFKFLYRTYKIVLLDECYDIMYKENSILVDINNIDDNILDKIDKLNGSNMYCNIVSFLCDKITNNLKYLSDADLVYLKGNLFRSNVDNLRLLSSKSIYPLVYNRLLSNYNFSFNAIDINQSSIEKVLGVPKTLLKEIRDLCKTHGRYMNIRTIVDSVNDALAYTSKVSFKNKKSIGLVSLLLSYSYRLSDIEAKLRSDGIGNVFGTSTDFASIMKYLCSLVCRRNYNIHRLYEYISKSYEKQGISCIKCLQVLDDYSRMAVSMGLRYDKYPVSVKLLHDLTLCKFRLIKDDNKNKFVAKIREENKSLEHSYGNYSIILPNCCDDFVKEGNALRHCVASYVDKVIEEDSIIAFLRNNEKMNESLATIEIVGRRVIQFRAFSNKKPSSELTSIVKKWCKDKDLIFQAY